MANNNNRHKIFTSSNDLLNIFLPMIDDEEQRRLEELEEEADGNFINEEILE